MPFIADALRKAKGQGYLTSKFWIKFNETFQFQNVLLESLAVLDVKLPISP